MIVWPELMSGIAPQCRMLQTARAKLKSEPGDEKKNLKAECGPSPNKKLASEMEKKIKKMPGDTSIVKAGL